MTKKRCVIGLAALVIAGYWALHLIYDDYSVSNYTQAKHALMLGICIR